MTALFDRICYVFAPTFWVQKTNNFALRVKCIKHRFLFIDFLPDKMIVIIFGTETLR